MLNFAAHFKEKIAKARTGIGLIKHLRQYLPTNILDQICKMHVRSHLDYCDFVHHIPELKKESEDDEGAFDGYEKEGSDHEDENADI